MKRYFLAMLLTVGVFIPLQAQKHWTDPFSVYQTAVQAAPPDSKDMMISLAVMWDLLSEDTDVTKLHKKQGEESFYKKFSLYPRQVNLSDSITSFRQYKAQCVKAQDTCKATYKNFQAKIKEKDIKITDQTAEIERVNATMSDLNKVINAATLAEETLLKASEDLRASTETPDPLNRTPEQLVELVATAYKAYCQAFYQCFATGKELNINMREESYFIDGIIKGQIDPFPGYSQAKIKAEAIDEAQKMSIDETIKAVDEAITKIGSELPEELKPPVGVEPEVA